MIKILLCCGGGFSSSALATKMKKDIYSQKLENDVAIDFYPFSIAKKNIKSLILLCVVRT